MRFSAAGGVARGVPPRPLADTVTRVCMSTLVIVESPTKARTIRAFLPKGFQVMASMGHIRDLPDGAKDVPAKYKGQEWARLGVNVANDFEPLYVVPAAKKKVVKELQDALKEADAADPRDGRGPRGREHLLAPAAGAQAEDRRSSRMVFHEITREAIQEALDAHPRRGRAAGPRPGDATHPRPAGRLYPVAAALEEDRLGPSAGRVQSVAVRLLVDRERERKAFHSGTWWDLKATLDQHGAGLHGRTGHPRRGRALAGGPRTSTRRPARSSRGRTSSSSTRPPPRRSATGWPRPPLGGHGRRREARGAAAQAAVHHGHPPEGGNQPDSSCSAREAMRIAQSLYEQGYITYMRTDSVHLSDQAVEAARESSCASTAGTTCRPSRGSTAARARNAQEAHEAIRPAGAHFRTPEETGLGGRERDLYDLIWKRTVACQMAGCPGHHRHGVHRRGRGAVPRLRHAHRFRRLPPRLRRGLGRSRGGARGAGGASCRISSRGRPARLRVSRRCPTPPSRRPGTPRPPWSRSSRRRRSAGPAPTPASSGRSSTGGTPSSRARRWCRPSPPSR